MITTHAVNIESIKTEIAAQLGLNPKTLPTHVNDRQAADVLGVKPTTLAVWRSTGRYRLPFLKVGRLVKYRVSDLAEFLARLVSIAANRADIASQGVAAVGTAKALGGLVEVLDVSLCLVGIAALVMHPQSQSDIKRTVHRLPHVSP